MLIDAVSTVPRTIKGREESWMQSSRENLDDPRCVVSLYEVSRLCNVNENIVNRWILRGQLAVCHTWTGEMVFRIIDVKAAYEIYLENPNESVRC